MKHHAHTLYHNLSHSITTTVLQFGDVSTACGSRELKIHVAEAHDVRIARLRYLGLTTSFLSCKHSLTSWSKLRGAM